MFRIHFLLLIGAAFSARDSSDDAELQSRTPGDGDGQGLARFEALGSDVSQQVDETQDVAVADTADGHAVDTTVSVDNDEVGVKVPPIVDETTEVEDLDPDADGDGAFQAVDDAMGTEHPLDETNNDGTSVGSEVGVQIQPTVDETADVEDLDDSVVPPPIREDDEVDAQVHTPVDETDDLKDQSEDVAIETTAGLDESDTAAEDVVVAAEEEEKEWTGSSCCLCVKGPDDPHHIYSYSKTGTCRLCKHGTEKKKKAPAGCIRGQPDYKSTPEKECAAQCQDWAGKELK